MRLLRKSTKKIGCANIVIRIASGNPRLFNCRVVHKYERGNVAGSIFVKECETKDI